MSAVWENHRVVVCVGTGGVGKTTVAASLALAAAASGKRTLVMTIDPARRLAMALGLSGISNEPHRLDAKMLAEHGVTLLGELSVLMPDVKRTFDTLIERWAPDAATVQEIKSNRIYQHFSSALAGSHEYAAVEKLYEVDASGQYDLIVLDTPPAQHAIDFLEAPGRILDFLDTENLGWLKKPAKLASKLSLRLLDLGAPVLFKTVGKLAGGDTLQELLNFLMSLQGMYAGFRERSQRVQALLASPELAFVLVGGPAKPQQDAMKRFRSQLKDAHLDVHAVVLNRVRAPIKAQAGDGPVASPAPPLGDAVAPYINNLSEADRATVLQAVREEVLLAERDSAAVQGVREAFAGAKVVVLPELAPDTQAIASLARLRQSFA